MFGFFRRKKQPPATPDTSAPAAPDTSAPAGPDTGAAAAPETSAAAAPEDTRGATAVPGPGAIADVPRSDAADELRPISGGFAAGPAAAAPAPADPAPAVAAPAPATGAAASAGSAAGMPAATAASSARAGWLGRLKRGLDRTRGGLAGLFSPVRLDEALYEELETALLLADTGVETTTYLLETLRERVRRHRLESREQAREALRAILADLLRPLEQPIDIDRAEPLVMMIAGVNGAGKTTSIGKLARHLQREGKSILLAAGDTFRAAAREQLAEWGARNDVQVIAQDGGDPAAVAFDAVSAGIARRTGVVIVDTAGRLPTQTHLMEELRKIHRVTGKAMPGAPHEVLLVLDGNTGQNMLAQVRAFDAAVPLTGLVVTKLDGTAKGGAIAALARTGRARPIPVYFIGVGEGIDDLQAFSADEFASALLD